jgi:hypothetical protein
MRKPTIKAIVALVLAFGVFSAFIVWYPFAHSLIWPSLALARVGVPHSWVASAILFVGGFIWVGFWSRNHGWSRVIFASLVASASYCVIAFLFAARAPVPFPATTAYDSTPALRTAYLQAYDVGYRDGMLGVMRTYCFYPEVETRGFYDGAYQGTMISDRVFGRTMPVRTKHLFQTDSAIDGAMSESK